MKKMRLVFFALLYRVVHRREFADALPWGNMATKNVLHKRNDRQ